MPQVLLNLEQRQSVTSAFLQRDVWGMPVLRGFQEVLVGGSSWQLLVLNLGP